MTEQFNEATDEDLLVVNGDNPGVIKQGITDIIDLCRRGLEEKFPGLRERYELHGTLKDINGDEHTHDINDFGEVTQEEDGRFRVLLKSANKHKGEIGAGILVTGTALYGLHKTIKLIQRNQQKNN